MLQTPPPARILPSEFPSGFGVFQTCSRALGPQSCLEGPGIVRGVVRGLDPKCEGYFGKLVRAAPGRCNRFRFPSDRLPKSVRATPGICAEDIAAPFIVGNNFPKYSRHFGKAVRESQPPTIFSKYSRSFSRNIPNISGNAIVEISGVFRKMVWSTTIEISGIFGPGFERSRCVFQIKSRGIYLPVHSYFG